MTIKNKDKTELEDLIRKSKPIMDDLFKFGEKVNAMFKVSLHGDCPQVLKLVMMRKMTEQVLDKVKSTNKIDGDKKMKEAENLVENVMKDITCESKIADEEDYEEYDNKK